MRYFILAVIILCGGGIQVLAATETATTQAITAEGWDTLTKEKKIGILTGVIEGFKNKGVAIRKEAAFYVEEIDIDRSGKNSAVMAQSIGEHFKSLAILYRDFDYGKDPQELLKQSLGEKDYQAMLKEDAFNIMDRYYEGWKKKHEAGKAE